MNDLSVMDLNFPEYDFNHFDENIFLQSGTEGFADFWKALKALLSKIIKNITGIFSRTKKEMEAEPTFFTYVSTIEENIKKINEKASQLTEPVDVEINASKFPSLQTLKQWPDLKKLSETWAGKTFLLPGGLEKVTDEIITNLSKLTSSEYSTDESIMNLISARLMVEEPLYQSENQEMLNRTGIKTNDGKITVNFTDFDKGDEKTILKVSTTFSTDDNYYSVMIKIFEQYKKIKENLDDFNQKYGTVDTVIEKSLTKLNEALDKVTSDSTQYDKTQFAAAKNDIQKMIRFCQLETGFVLANKKFYRLVRRMIAGMINQIKKQLFKEVKNEDKPATESLFSASVLATQIDFHDHPLVLDYQFDLLTDQIDDYLSLDKLQYQRQQPATEGFKLGCLIGSNRLHHEHPDDWKKGMEAAEGGILASIGKFFMSIFEAIGKFFNWLFNADSGMSSSWKVTVKMDDLMGTVLKNQVTLPYSTTIDMSNCLALSQYKKLLAVYDLDVFLKHGPSSAQGDAWKMLMQHYFDPSIWNNFNDHLTEIRKATDIFKQDHQKFLELPELKALQEFGVKIENNKAIVDSAYELPKEANSFKIELHAGKMMGVSRTSVVDNNGYIDTMMSSTVGDWQSKYEANLKLGKLTFDRIKDKLKNIKKEDFNSKENLNAFAKESRSVIGSMRIILGYLSFWKGLNMLVIRETKKISAQLKKELLSKTGNS